MRLGGGWCLIDWWLLFATLLDRGVEMVRGHHRLREGGGWAPACRPPAALTQPPAAPNPTVATSWTHLLSHQRLGPLLAQPLLLGDELVPPRLPHLGRQLSRWASAFGWSEVGWGGGGISNKLRFLPAWHRPPSPVSTSRGGTQQCHPPTPLPASQSPSHPAGRTCSGSSAMGVLFFLPTCHLPPCTHIADTLLTHSRTPHHTCSGSSAAGVPSSSLYWKAPMRSKRKEAQKSTSSRWSASLSPAIGWTGGGRRAGSTDRHWRDGPGLCTSVRLRCQTGLIDLAPCRAPPTHPIEHPPRSNQDQHPPGKPEMKVVRSASPGTRSRSVCSSLRVCACGGRFMASSCRAGGGEEGQPQSFGCPQI